MVYHTPVMLDEVIDNLIEDPNGIYVDLTFGGGGHSKEIIKRLNKGHLYAFDQDKDVVQNLKDFEQYDNFTFINSNGKHIKQFLEYYDVKRINGVFLDLGISSYQIDTPERGFSTRFLGDLDMRMNKNANLTAQIVVNEYSASRLQKIFKEYGELENSSLIVETIVDYRKKKQITTTNDLKEILLKNVKMNTRYQAKFLSKVFQAIRIEVNDELNTLKDILTSVRDILTRNDRIVVISYHSLEDRIVKNFFKCGNFNGVVDKDFYGNITTPFKPLYKKPITPSINEIISNNRSRSARLRVGIKL